MGWEIFLAVIGAGVLSGFINTLAGNGSLITLPLLIFAGLPATVANGTNRIAILLQSAVGVKSFHDQKVLDHKGSFRLAVPAIIGSLIGAQIAVDIDKDMMEKVIGVIMLITLVVILVKPKRWLQETSRKEYKYKYLIEFVIFFFIGLYGGFIQAGVGIFLLISLVLGAGYDLVKANAIKVFIVLLYTPFVLGVFIFNNQIDYLYGFTLAGGSMIGAYIATKVAVRKGAEFVRWILIVVILFSAIKLLFFK